MHGLLWRLVLISYSTNWMGPIRKSWCDEHGDYWSGGRIDIRGVPDEPWGLEYGLPIMHTEDWNALSDWLDDLKTEELWSFDDIITQYEQQYNRKIRWLKDDNAM